MNKCTGTDYWNSLSAYDRNVLVGEVLGKDGLELAHEFLPKYTEDDGEACSLLHVLPTLDYGKKSYNDEHYQYRRTTITHSKNGIKVCIETDGFSFRAEAPSLAEALALSLLRAMGLNNV